MFQGVSTARRVTRTAATQSLREAVRLARPYFRSSEAPRAWSLLAAIVALNLFLVYLNVVYTYWYKIAYNALQDKSAPTFWASMFTYRFVRGFPLFVPGFVEIAVLSICAAVYAFYLNQMLEIRWRRWLTAAFSERWLERQAYYRLGLAGSTGVRVDNPDQRISEDIPSVVASTLSLGISLLSNFVTLLSFVGVLWFIAPPLRVGAIVVPGYLVWSALAYSVVGTVLTQLIGRALVSLNVQQQRVDADFRFSLVRIREHTEQIALMNGEAAERADLRERFAAIYTNWWSIMRRTKALNFFTNGFTQIAIIFPLLVTAPGYFQGILTLGVLMQVASIFGSVQGALSWFVGAYPDIVGWRAAVKRLADFDDAIRAAHDVPEAGSLIESTGEDKLRLSGLTIATPDGRTIAHNFDLGIRNGSGPVVLTGASGTGKSTVFRTIAGIWPFAAGLIERPAGRLLFLPQDPYLARASLKAVATYPDAENTFDDDVVRGALTEVGLPLIAGDLAAVRDWALALSGGEQQRLAIARALVIRPDWLFLDEALSALDEPSARSLFALLRERLPDTQIVSITHDAGLAALHGQAIAINPTSVIADLRHPLTS
jgi:vitamin B12/bleomycin/antimicrobial peptide transport system ATP-binding/permease protein